jgi:hypothetical protein
LPLSVHKDLPEINEISEKVPEKPASPDWEKMSQISTTQTWVNDSSLTVNTHVGTILDAPMKKEMTSSEMEDQTSIWARFDQETLPEKDDIRIVRLLRHQIFKTYWRLFGFVFFINFWIFIAAAAEGWNALKISKGVFGNLFLAVIVRQDYLVDALFGLVSRVPSYWPMWVRKIAADIHQVEGIHAGAAASSTLWFLLYTGKATREAAVAAEDGQRVGFLLIDDDDE